MQHASERPVPVRATVTLPGQPRYVRWARELVTIAVGRGHPGYEPLVLIVSELVTNSIVHSRSRLAGGTVTVTLLRSPGGALNGQDSIRVEVIDDGAAGLPVLRPTDSATVGGRGLRLVDALAASWNCARDPAGTTTTWADVIV
jgi:anti-sigma regulatory factor (Ser/Thr protein kinase)